MGKIKNKYNLLNYAIFLFFVSSPMESISIGESFSLAKLSAIFVIIAWIFKKCPLPHTNMIKTFVVFLVYSLLTTIWSINPQNTINQIITFLIPSLVVAIAISVSIKDINDMAFYLRGYVLGCIIAAISGIYYRDALLNEAIISSQERITALGADQNALAFLLIMGVVCILGNYPNETIKWRRIISIFGMGIFIIMILSTGSRTGLLILLSVFAGYFLTQTKRSFRSTLLIIVLIIAAIPFLIRYIPESIWERFSETNQMVSNGDFSDRGAIWRMGISSLSEENFVTGVGYANFKSMLIKHFGQSWASHNTYLSYLSEFGFVGFFVFLYVLIVMYQYSKKIAKKTGNKFIYMYIIPYLIIMITLETEYKRWMFIIGIMLEAYYKLLPSINRKVNNENITNYTNVR